MMRKIRYLFFLLWVAGSYCTSMAQGGISSRNGYHLPTKGELRIFIVYAEIINMSNDPGALGSWQPGRMPSNAGYYARYLEKFFQEASFGEYNVLVDYCPSLVQLEPFSGDGRDEVFRALKNIAVNDTIITSNGLSFPQDFDQWTITNTTGGVNINTPDEKVDFIVFYFRNNLNISPTRNSGFTETNNKSFQFLGKKGYNGITLICAPKITDFIRHEFAHSLLGGNPFHSGNRNRSISNYLHDYSGYGLLSGADNSNPFCNAWDRRRLGWKHPEKNYYIGALDPYTGIEEDSDLAYIPNSTVTKEYVLRDFTQFGDVVRIQLPYLENPVNPQWIWLENHQVRPNTTEYKQPPINNKGMYVSYQVGNESFTSFSSRTNYYTPQISLGSYDIRERVPVISTDHKERLRVFTEDSLANPFTGCNFGTLYAYDNNGNNKLENNEETLAYRVTIGSNEIPPEDIHFLEYPLYGSVYDSFKPGQKLSVSTNPAPVPRLTFRKNDTQTYTVIETPDSIDNRKIHLNGLRIEMVEQYEDGDIRVRVRFNDYDIDNDVRWCGDIVLHEKLYLNSGSTLLLDQGLTATRPVSPVTFQGKQIFADPTYFTCRDGSHLTMRKGSKAILGNNSSLITENGSKLYVIDSKLTVKSGSTLKIRQGSTLSVRESGQIVVERGGFLCVEEGATIFLTSKDSYIFLEEGSSLGVNPNTLSQTSGHCISSVSDIRTVSSGTLAEVLDEGYLQNEIVSGSRELFGKRVKAGSNVTTQRPQGEVIVPNGASLKLVSTTREGIRLEKGFTAEKGAVLELLSASRPE